MISTHLYFTYAINIVSRFMVDLRYEKQIVVGLVYTKRIRNESFLYGYVDVDYAGVLIKRMSQSSTHLLHLTIQSTKNIHCNIWFLFPQKSLNTYHVHRLLKMEFDCLGFVINQTLRFNQYLCIMTVKFLFLFPRMSCILTKQNILMLN